jgi:hypothetical protein
MERMATHSTDLNNLDGASVSLDRDQLCQLIDHEARLVGLSGAHEAVERVRQGDIGQGLMWDDLTLLVSLLRK